MLLVSKTIKRGRGRTNDHLVQTQEGRRVEVSRLFYDDNETIKAEDDSQHQRCGGGRRIVRKRIGGA